MDEEVVEFKGQPGPQTEFLKCEADICIFGGAAGGSKTYGLLLDPLRHYDNPNFESVIFRRNNKQVRNTGGLWDTSRKIYPFLNGIPHETYLKWKFPSGFGIRFDGLEQENSVHDWQGAQIPHIGFDELTHFTEYQFMYLMSRNRSNAGTPGRIRATTNPDPDSWVRWFIDWWIGEDGYPIKARSGKLRYFVRRKDKIIWGNSKREIYEKVGKGPDILPKSLTFIPARLEDNKILMKDDPSYKATLLSMGHVEVERLYRGNWNIRPSTGDMFDRDRFEIVDNLPAGWTDQVRFWDKAGTKPNEKNKNPDWTRGLKMVKYPNGLYIVVDVRSTRDEPGEVNAIIKTIATQDGYACRIKEQQDPGQAGKEEAQNFTRMLSGFNVSTQPFSRNKVLRSEGVRAQVFARNVKLLKGSWNEDFLRELHAWTGDENETDDQVDAFSGAFNELAGVPTMDQESTNRMGRILGG